MVNARSTRTICDGTSDIPRDPGAGCHRGICNHHQLVGVDESVAGKITVLGFLILTVSQDDVFGSPLTFMVLPSHLQVLRINALAHVGPIVGDQFLLNGELYGP